MAEKDKKNSEEQNTNDEKFTLSDLTDDPAIFTEEGMKEDLNRVGDEFKQVGKALKGWWSKTFKKDKDQTEDKSEDSKQPDEDK